MYIKFESEPKAQHLSSCTSVVMLSALYALSALFGGEDGRKATDDAADAGLVEPIEDGSLMVMVMVLVSLEQGQESVALAPSHTSRHCCPSSTWSVSSLGI